MSEAVAALMSGLDPQQSSRLTAAVAQITAASVQRFGIAPTLEEVVATAMVKEATYGDGTSFDMENALFQLSKEAATVVSHLSASADAGQPVQQVGRFADSGVVTQTDIDDMPPHLRAFVKVGMTGEDLTDVPSAMRMSVARALSGSKIDRNPSALVADEVKDAPKPKTDTDAPNVFPRHAVQPHAQLTSAAARMSEARRGAK